MAKARKKRRVKFIYRHSSTLLKSAVLAAIIFSTAALLILKNAVNQANIAYESLRVEAAQEQHRHRQLETYLRQHGTVDGIKQYAEDVLGYVDPDTKFFKSTPKD